MLSAVIICQDEEAMIEPCLQSLAFADEIIVVDSGSSDRTIEICRRYTDRIFHQDWLGMNKQKAFAATKASGDWILNIDADERISAELQDEICEVLSNEDIGKNGFYIPRKAFYLGKWLKHGAWSPDLKLRLVRAELARWVGTDPHDEIAVPEPTGKLNSPILHYSFPNLAAHWNSNLKYGEIAAKEMMKKGKKVSLITIFSHSIFAFLKSFFIKRGFLEGTRGFIQAAMIASGVMVKYALLWEKQKQNKNL